MNFSSLEILEQLDSVDSEFDFTPHCPEALMEYIIGEGLVDFVDDIPMLTYTGQLAVGYSKEDLNDIYVEDEQYE